METFSLVIIGIIMVKVYGHDSATDSSNRPMVNGGWTKWFNVDRPSNEGDFETRGMIELTLIQQRRYICPPGVQFRVDAECKVTKTGEIFRHQSITPVGDYLQLPCTKNGLKCVNKDQSSGVCHDYSIRFFCSFEDPEKNSMSTEAKPTTDPSTDGSHNIFSSIDYRIYLIIALVPVSVLLMRIWCSFLRRKRHRTRENRDSRGNQSPEDINHELAQPPPSYSEIFGRDSQTGAISGTGLHLMSTGNRICKECMRSQRRMRDNREVPSITQNTESSSTQIDISIEASGGEQSTSNNDGTLDDSGAVGETREQSSTEITLVVNRSTNSVLVRDDICCLCRANRCIAYDNMCFTDERGNHFRPPGMHLSPSIARNASETSFCSIPPPTYSEALDILKNSEA